MAKRPEHRLKHYAYVHEDDELCIYRSSIKQEKKESLRAPQTLRGQRWFEFRPRGPQWIHTDYLDVLVVSR